MLGCAVPPDTVEVGTYLLGNSPFDVWDMSGNVWEWVHDWYAENYYAFSPASNPLGPGVYQDADNPLKVVRGGGLYSAPDRMRGAGRTGANPYRAYDDVGFRCVANENLSLPEGYVPPLDRHEMVPPDPLDGGGDPVEDPASVDWYRIGFGNASCPTLEGRMHIVVEAATSLGMDYSVTVEGNPFDCYYDDMLHLLHCEGPIPENNDELDQYDVEVRFGEDGPIGHIYIDRPTDCGAPPPERFSIDLDCPVDGLFVIRFYYEPPIVWDITRQNDANIPCWPVGPGEMRCTAIEGWAVDGHYEFYLHGTDETGAEYEWLPWVPVLEGCPVDWLDLRYDVVTNCYDITLPVVDILFHPETESIISVTVDDVPLDCFLALPGDYTCRLPDDAPAGDVLEIDFCFAGDLCYSEAVTVLDCASEPPEEIGYIIEPYCYPPEAPAPAASIHYWPFDEHLVAATAGDTALACSDWGVGWYVCPDVPGAVGENVTISACLEDGTCFTGPLTIPDCGSTGEVDGWRMASIGCFDETRIYFSIDTGLDLFGLDVTYTATDGETTYSCETHPTLGRVYCTGTRPETPGPLEFCLQRLEDPAPICQTYPDFPIWVAGIPPCAPEEPVEPAPVDPCSAYTTYLACVAHKDQCSWVTDHCESNP